MTSSFEGLQALEDFKLWRTSNFGGLQTLEDFKLWRTPSRLSASAQINGCIIIAVVVLGYMTGCCSQHDSSWLLIFITQPGIVKITKIWLHTGRIFHSSILGRECHLERVIKVIFGGSVILPNPAAFVHAGRLEYSLIKIIIIRVFVGALMVRKAAVYQ